MACSLSATWHHLNQFYLVVYVNLRNISQYVYVKKFSYVLWKCMGKFWIFIMKMYGKDLDMYYENVFQNYIFRIDYIFSWDQCVVVFHSCHMVLEILFNIGRSPRWGFLDHTFMLHCFTPPPGLQWVRLMAACNVTLIILVLEIPFNFQFHMQCAGNANSNVSFKVNASFEQILFLWHTWARSKGLRTIRSEWPDKSMIRPGLLFRVVNCPKITVWALG